MMIRFVNKDSGTIMWVEESRKDEYIAAGHKPAAAPAEKKAAERKTAVRTRKAK